MSRSLKPTAIHGQSLLLRLDRWPMIWSNVMTPNILPPIPAASVASDKAFVTASRRAVGRAAYKMPATTGARQSSSGIRAGYPISFHISVTSSSVSILDNGRRRKVPASLLLFLTVGVVANDRAWEVTLPEWEAVVDKVSAMWIPQRWPRRFKPDYLFWNVRPGVGQPSRCC